jgi:hypothetical protein
MVFMGQKHFWSDLFPLHTFASHNGETRSDDQVLKKLNGLICYEPNKQQKNTPTSIWQSQYRNMFTWLVDSCRFLFKSVCMCGTLEPTMYKKYTLAQQKKLILLRNWTESISLIFCFCACVSNKCWKWASCFPRVFNIGGASIVNIHMHLSDSNGKQKKTK